jgi:hypothetical protein
MLVEIIKAYGHRAVGDMVEIADALCSQLIENKFVKQVKQQKKK